MEEETLYDEDGNEVIVRGDFDVRSKTPEQLDGTELEWGDATLVVKTSSIEIESNGEAVLMIGREGWELDPYLMYCCIPAGLADEITELGFHHKRTDDGRKWKGSKEL